MGALAIVLFFVGLLVVILIHELAHYATARRFGFRVLEYFVGFGPRVWSTRRKGIEYGVKALPVGGYVRIAGMNPFVDDVPPGDEERAYGAKPIWQRAVVIASGPLSHFLVAAVLFTAVNVMVGDLRYSVDVATVDEHLADGATSPAFAAGLLPGDVILSADGVASPGAQELGDLIEASVGRPMPITVEREGEVHDLAVTPVTDCLGGSWGGTGMVLGAGAPVRVVTVPPELPGGAPSPALASGIEPGDLLLRVGPAITPSRAEVQAVVGRNQGNPIPIVLQRGDRQVATVLTPVPGCFGGTEVGRIGVLLGPRPLPVPLAVKEGVISVWDSARESVVSIGRVFGPQGVGRIASLLFTDADRDLNDPASVVGIGQQVGAVGEQGEWAFMILILAYVTVFIGLVNLLPLPPFDGGHLALLAIEKVRGRPVDMRRVVPVSAVVMAFLVTFVLATVIVDITKPLPTP
jgi:regulator of sigma E protease